MLPSGLQTSAPKTASGKQHSYRYPALMSAERKTSERGAEVRSVLHLKGGAADQKGVGACWCMLHKQPPSLGARNALQPPNQPCPPFPSCRAGRGSLQISGYTHAPGCAQRSSAAHMSCRLK